MPQESGRKALLYKILKPAMLALLIFNPTASAGMTTRRVPTISFPNDTPESGASTIYSTVQDYPHTGNYGQQTCIDEELKHLNNLNLTDPTGNPVVSTLNCNPNDRSERDYLAFGGENEVTRISMQCAVIAGSGKPTEYAANKLDQTVKGIVSTCSNQAKDNYEKQQAEQGRIAKYVAFGSLGALAVVVWCINKCRKTCAEDERQQLDNNVANPGANQQPRQVFPNFVVPARHNIQITIGSHVELATRIVQREEGANTGRGGGIKQ